MRTLAPAPDRQVRVYRMVDGQPPVGLNVLPVTSGSWVTPYAAEGSMRVTLPWSDLAEKLGLRDKTRAVKYALAVIEDGSVLAWGMLKSTTWNPDEQTLQLSAGDGWTFWKKRLVLNRALKSSWVDGEVLIDEDNPRPDWALTLNSTLAGIGAGVIAESLEWGPLLYDKPTVPPGSNTRTYKCWELPTVYDALRDLTEVRNGPNITWPAMLVDGVLHAQYVADPAPREFTVNTSIPGHHAAVTSVDEDGDSIASQVFGIGGRADDLLLVAMDRQTALEEAGWPLTQAANKDHTSVTELSTLRGYVQQDTTDGSTLPENEVMTLPAALRPRPGDIIHRQTEDPYLGGEVEDRVISQVTADLTSDTVTCDLFPSTQGA